MSEKLIHVEYVRLTTSRGQSDIIYLNCDCPRSELFYKDWIHVKVNFP